MTHDTAKYRTATMSPEDVLNRINDRHRRFIFPSKFEQLHFDMFCQMEYHFDVIKVKKKSRICITQSEFWIDKDRNPRGHLIVMLNKDEGLLMGRWLHNVVDAKRLAKKSGIIGFTAPGRFESMLKSGYEALAHTRAVSRNGSFVSVSA